MITGIATLAIASTAQAQQAVQWKVSDGGNGHWYQVVLQRRPFAESANHATSVGGFLAEIDSSTENSFCFGLASADLAAWYLPTVGFGQGPYVGSHRVSTGEWVHLSGASMRYSGWCSGQPDDYGGSQSVATHWAPTGQPSSCWDDVSPEFVNSSIVEWSADCNGDGIVDYGQCHDGTLADYNGNNIPDCCERGDVCVVGTYPVQWRTSEGGNGHWYQLDRAVLPWDAASNRASELGGALATISSLDENRIATAIAVRSGLADVWLGGFRSIDQSDWQWIGGESFVFSNWAPGAPWDGEYRFMELIAAPGATSIGRWNAELIFAFGPGQHSIFEWSTDCDADGIVDYGQLLTGQLADSNTDGVPDVCQQPNCVDADLFRDFNVNGADLGILLSQWGPNSPLTVSDINSDGVVNGADLGILLSFWGACSS
jgi:hypothetical protein